MKFTGTVVHGDAYGRTLGYPTANISGCEAAMNTIQPKLGVYAGYIEIAGKEGLLPAAIVVSESDGVSKLEAHILNFEGDLYGAKLTVTLQGFIRPYQNYADEAELIKAIADDIVKVREALGSFAE